jgi:hypothetical protein
MIELLTYYVIGGALLIGAPAVFFIIAFMPALMNTKGRMVGYKMREDGDVYWMNTIHTDGVHHKHTPTQP